jgi:CRP-like cAMP-binding protein
LKSSGTTLAWTTWLGKDRSRALVMSGHEASPADYEGEPYITISPESLQSETVTIKSRIFSRLPRGKQAEALRMMSKIAVPQHEVVMRQDERGTCMYVIRSGSVNLYRRTDHGKDTLLRILGAGDSFGERALLAGKPYSETAVAQTPCELYVAGRDQLMELFVRYPQLEQKIVVYLSQSEDASKRSDRKNGKSRR